MIRTLLLVLLIAGGAASAVPLNAADATTPAPFTVVCLGDSITGDRPGKPYLGAYLKWTDIVGAMIEARSGVGSARVINAGYAGDKTFAMGDKTGALARYRDQVIAVKPQVAVILIGGNDASVWKDKDDAAKAKGQADFAANLTTIVKDTQAAGIKVLLLQYHCLPDPAKPEAAWSHLDDYNPTIAAVAAETGAALLDMAAPMQAALDAGAPRTELVNEKDGVHLCPRGELVYAVTITRKLADLGWLPPAAP